MSDSRGHETLWRDTLLGDGLSQDSAPLAIALRALRARRQRRQAGMAVMTTAVVFGLCLTGWWAWPTRTLPPAVAQDVNPPRWIVRTGDLPPAAVVQTQATVNIVASRQKTSPGFVVHSRPGRYTPLSDDGLLALLGDRSPVLIGAPGERHLLLLKDEARP